MAKLTVKTEVLCTEKDGKKASIKYPVLEIRSHNVKANEVILSVEGINVTVPAEYLIRAINNATNQPGYI